MSVDFGMVIVGSAVWLFASFVIAAFVASATNVGSAIGRERRDPFDWLLLTATITASFFVMGQSLYWFIRLGMAIHNGVLFANGAG